MQFERAAHARSTSPRAMAFAALGAAELLAVDPDHRAARKLITDYAASVPAANDDPAWPWPEPRLTYANAVLPEAMIAAGCRAGRHDAAAARPGPVGLAGRIRNIRRTLVAHPRRRAEVAEDARPGFDQQPIEVATLADACARAAVVDASPIWPDGVRAAAAWFMGDNDAGQVMWDPETGGGYDGLHADGVNGNQGAESTLAVISTLQHAQRLSTVPQ